MSSNKNKKNAEVASSRQVVTFGYAPHNEDGSDYLPIEWLVLDEGDGLLLISKEILFSEIYHKTATDFTPVVWEDTDLRKALNGSFINNSMLDRSRLLPVGLGCPSQDLVTILSYQQVQQYLPTQLDRACTAAPYATAQSDTDDLWWLRMDRAGAFVWFVEPDGTVQTDFGYPCDKCGVRPVIRIKKG